MSNEPSPRGCGVFVLPFLLFLFLIYTGVIPVMWFVYALIPLAMFAFAFSLLFGGGRR